MTMSGASFEELYADLAVHDTLAAALQAALADIGSSLTVSDHWHLPGILMYSRVARRRRSAVVCVAADARQFSFDFWDRGVRLADGGAEDLRMTARAIDRWVSSECSTGTLSAEFTCVRVEPDSAMHERGEVVERRWQQYLEYLPEHCPELKEFLIAAAAHPKLRQLFPFTSVGHFCFSRCTSYPFTRDLPEVWPDLPFGAPPDAPVKYSVFGDRVKDRGPFTAEEAVKAVVAALPPNCGPAVQGTKEYLDET
jgi:hypothetical protein